MKYLSHLASETCLTPVEHNTWITPCDVSDRVFYESNKTVTGVSKSCDLYN